MRVSISWLKQLVQVNESVDDLSERLSMAGFEVEEIDDSTPRPGGCCWACLSERNIRMPTS